MKHYFINFFVWWYGYIFLNYFKDKVYEKYLNLLHKNRVIPMIISYRKPLYGDNSYFGRILGIIIRTGWIFLGSVHSTIIIIPNMFLALVIFCLPFWPLFILFFISN